MRMLGVRVRRRRQKSLCEGGSRRIPVPGVLHRESASRTTMTARWAGDFELLKAMEELAGRPLGHR